MKPTPTEDLRISIEDLPAALRLAIAEAIALTALPPDRVPDDRRVSVAYLRKELRGDELDIRAGCIVSALAYFALTFIGLDFFHAFFGAMVPAILVSVVESWVRGRRRVPKTLTWKALRAAGDVAGFGRTEWAAIEASIAPRAGEDVLREIDRLLQEDARLRAALDEIDPVEHDPIEADHLRLRLALARETDESTRRALEASLAVCERRLQGAKTAERIRGRIEAHRELVLQSLRATEEALARGGSSEIDLAPVREVAANLASEATAIESAVQEMRAS